MLQERALQAQHEKARLEHEAKRAKHEHHEAMTGAQAMQGRMASYQNQLELLQSENHEREMWHNQELG